MTLGVQDPHCLWKFIIYYSSWGSICPKRMWSMPPSYPALPTSTLSNHNSSQGEWSTSLIKLSPVPPFKMSSQKETSVHIYILLFMYTIHIENNIMPLNLRNYFKSKEPRAIWMIIHGCTSCAEHILKYYKAFHVSQRTYSEHQRYVKPWESGNLSGSICSLLSAVLYSRLTPVKRLDKSSLLQDLVLGTKVFLSYTF